MKRKVPLVALLLTLLGLLPFGAATAGLWLEARGDQSLSSMFHSVTPAFVMTSYGVVILAFLGGIHWGFATMYVSRNRRGGALNLAYIWSVVVATIAFSVFLMPTLKLQIALLMLAFFLQWMADVWMLQVVKNIPEWYFSLRTLVTLLLLPILLFAYFAV